MTTQGSFDLILTVCVRACVCVCVCVVCVYVCVGRGKVEHVLIMSKMSTTKRKCV